MKRKPHIGPVETLPADPVEDSAGPQKPLEIIPRAFLVPRLDLALLTQPLRRDRSRPHIREPETWRAAFRKIHSAWQGYRQLMGLTVTTFREHLVKDLQGLPLTEESRRSLLDLLKNVPDDPLFWQVLQDAWQVLRNAEQMRFLPVVYDEDLTVWNGAYFCSRFAGAQPPVPSGWVQSAFAVLDALNVLRVSAAQLNERSHLLRTVWEQGQENALIAAFQEGAPDRWVERSRLDLQEQQMTGKTREERKRATTVLREMGKALTAIGEGRTEEIGPQEKEAITAACRYWLPVSQKLNKDLRKLWETPAWQSVSREARENSMDALAKKHSLSVEEVKTVVRFLRGSSQRGTATPWQATCALVAEKYGVGAGTVEKIYGDSLKTHPEYRTRKRKIPTSQVAERIP